MSADSDNSELLSADPIVTEATNRFRRCAEWESTCRQNFLEDYKFAHGDSENGYQWPNRIRNNRDLDSRPCLTMNVVRQHNLQIVNEAKQNKSSVAFRATGGDATKDAADLYEALFRRVEYRSDAQAAYETACEYQVSGGWGWFRLITEYQDNKTFNQDFKIKRVWDPLSVYMDMDCQEKNCSDGKYAFVFDLVPDGELEEAYPELKDKMAQAPLGAATVEDSWNLKDHTRVCEYFRKVAKRDVLVSFMDPGTRVRKEIKKSQVPPEIFKELISTSLSKSRGIEEFTVEWYLIVGQQVVDKTVWPGKYIPLIRVIGEETIIDGVLDRKGHTRAMKDAQRMYNYNAMLALDTKIPTPTGWTTVGQLEAGMEIFDQNGQPVQIKSMLPVYENKDCYKITFDNGYTVTTDAGHIWKVEERGKRKAATWNWKTKTVCTAELTTKKHYIKVPGPLTLPEQDLLVEPYVLGAWLGDGHKGTGGFSAHVDDAAEEKKLFAELGYSSGAIISDRVGTLGVHFTVNGLRKGLAKIGVLNTKHVPQQYLRGSRNQRLALLQGLMDTYGHFALAVNQCVFVNTNKLLAKAVLELCASLGIKATLTEQPSQASIFPDGKTRISKANYRIQFTADPDVPVFRLARKVQLQTAGRNTHWRCAGRIGVKSIVRVESVPVRCLTLDTPEHLFLCGEGMIPTHNSAQVEFGALQGKTPWIAAAKAIEEYETMWNTANVVNHSVLIYNNVDDQGNKVDPPARTEPPKAAPIFETGMQTAFNQMMMTSGQWQNQMGMGGNERTGEAISRRQEQGYTAVFHFQNNYADALKFLGKQFLDVVPKIYDTKRLFKLQMDNGEEFDLQLDPGAKQGLQLELDHEGKVISRVLNPRLGEFDVQSDVGPAYGTRREETVKAMTLLLTQNPALTSIIGDLLLNAMQFKEAEEAARRMKRMVPPQALGKGPSPQEAALQKQLETTQGALSKALQQIGKDGLKLVGKEELRDIEVHEAETKRMAVLLKQLPIDADGMKMLIHQLVEESLQTHLQPIIKTNEAGVERAEEDEEDRSAHVDTPPMPGAKKAKDGEWYVADPSRQGKYLHVGAQQ